MRSLMRSPICADEKSEGRTGHVSPPQGRGELGGRNQSGRIGFVPAGTGPLFANERMFVQVATMMFQDVRVPVRPRWEPTSVLEKALALGTVVLALTIEDRERLL